MFEPNQQKSGTLFFDLLKFLLIFLVILVAVLIVYHSGILDTESPPTETIDTTPIQTLPPITTTTPPPITTTSETETTAWTTTAPTETDPTYPPATVPTTKATTTATTTQTTTVPPQPPLDVMDISDEAMEKLIDVRILPIHDTIRPDEKLWSVDNIVVHYVGNAGTSAINNWRYFNNTDKASSVSAHFIIGLNGEIIQAVPLDEVAYAVGTYEGNRTSISIECCHPDASGKFTDATYESLVKLVSWLCNKFDLSREDVLRHYDYERTSSSGIIWHKECPLYWANTKDPESHKRWEAFKDDLILEN